MFYHNKNLFTHHTKWVQGCNVGRWKYTERKNDLALNQKSIKIKFCENGVNSDLKMI